MAVYLEVAIVLDYERWFPNFRAAFEPSEVNWDVDPTPFLEQVSAMEHGKTTATAICI